MCIKPVRVLMQKKNMQIFKLNYRDKLGLLAFSVLAILISWFALFIMVGREVYQWKHYHLSKFEWEDVIRYGFIIILVSLIRSLTF